MFLLVSVSFFLFPDSGLNLLNGFQLFFNLKNSDLGLLFLFVS